MAGSAGLLLGAGVWWVGPWLLDPEELHRLQHMPLWCEELGKTDSKIPSDLHNSGFIFSMYTKIISGDFLAVWVEPNYLQSLCL